MESVGIRSFYGPYFPAFELNTERYSVSLLIQSECGKTGTRKIPNANIFYVVLMKLNLNAHFPAWNKILATESPLKMM